MILNDEMNLISYEGGNLMYVFNKITVTPQLPERINKLSEIAGNLWWAWNTDFLKLFKIIDGDLWETVGKNPVKFLKLVSQERLEKVAENPEFLKEYDKIANDFYDYMNSKSTWFKKNYPDNKDRFGDVDTGYSGRFPDGSQGCPDAGSVVPLSAAGIQNYRMLAHKRQNPATKCI